MAALPPTPDNQGTPTRPYLLRALHEWCTDNGFTPYLSVFVDASVQVPMEYVKNNEIVLNVGLEATHGLNLGNDFVEFKARFGGVAREIVVPVDHVIAIYARENGQGMAFPAPSESGQTAIGGPGTGPRAPGLRLATSPAPAEPSTASLSIAPLAPVPDPTEPPPDGPTPGGRPSLKRVK